jgi:hypothetical protein
MQHCNDQYDDENFDNEGSLPFSYFEQKHKIAEQETFENGILKKVKM